MTSESFGTCRDYRVPRPGPVPLPAGGPGPAVVHVHVNPADGGPAGVPRALRPAPGAETAGGRAGGPGHTPRGERIRKRNRITLTGEVTRPVLSHTLPESNF
ncbi:hypothetical protein Kpho02_47120 [Kitasatospora phosalacinea]|uniref:Uncharacterized protein n=1 Tax=Kitasatospora phosalacinea TaxID=2065 RepID=A0A9W6QCJ8_9ACTN|nr:hypothetical protein Kpho02_47120 [Kitasatospora phosalacinea]